MNLIRKLRSKNYRVIEVFVITKQRIPIKEKMPISHKDGKYGVEYEGEFYPVDPKKVFLARITKLFGGISYYKPFIILCPEYNPDIVHSLSKEQFEKRLLESLT